MATYKGPDGRLYRVSAAPDTKGGYYIEYRDPACSAVYKPLPGYAAGADRAEVAERLGMAAQRQKWTVVEGDFAAKSAPMSKKPKGTGVWLYGDHRAMRVGIGSDTERSDARYYHVLVLNLLADKPCWRKLSGAGNYDHTHLDDAGAELQETLPGDAHELTAAQAEQLFTSPGSGWFDLKPNAVKVWDKIMAASSAATKIASALIPEWAIPIAQDFVTYKWVRELEDFSAACFQASSEAQSYTGGTCGTGFADASPEGIKLWVNPQQGIEYTWTKFVQACKAMGIQPAHEAAPAAAEPQEIVDESSEQDTPPAAEPAAIAVPPAADIAAPGFDFGADEPTNTALLQCAQAFVAGRLAQVMAAKRAHELTANNKNGAFGKWCEAVGISRDTGNNLVNIADNFGNIELDGRPLVEITPISLLAIGSKPSAPLELKRGIESGDITTTKQYRELEAQLKATEEAKTEAERKVKGLEASYHTAHANEEYNIDLRKKATEEAEKAKAQATEAQRRAEQAERKAQEQDEMLADLQDRLDDTAAQLRSRPVPAEVVDQDEVERRARELAAEKIAEALGAQERQPLCDLAMTLNNAIRSAWDLSGLDDREPESEDDDTALEVLHETLCQIAEWAAGRIDPDGLEEAMDQ